MTQQPSFQLTILRPLRPSDIPNQSTIDEAGLQLLKSTYSWKAGKTFNGVKTYSRSKTSDDGAPWFCRVSEHASSEVDFDTLWRALSVNKAETEKQFIPEISKVTKVKDLTPQQQIWTMLYKFSPPIADRIFTVVQSISLHEESGRRSGLVVSIPVDLSGDHEASQLEAAGVRGKYVSVEQLVELENGSVEWRMATSSSPGGRIPSFIVDSTMASTIAKDVPHLLSWLKGQTKTKS
ncbi:hypothetical protein DL96DRAFT_1710171 [Flagelloscypha sp. PMI_526]|nr:hypothetical protein DL96DRAFT_1710171 [Flagelloscypha sp. PMI_526]